MHPSVITKSPNAVEAEAQSIYVSMFPNGDRSFVPRVFGLALQCFSGKYQDYQAVDAQYHDFEHTLQGTLCMVRLLRGRHLAAAEPKLTQRMFELGLIAILLHDTGYLKKRDDTQGTGAKYTVIHVRRSTEFAAYLLTEKGFVASEIQAVQNMIQCTGVDADLSVIPFQSDLERIAGCALASADLLGQMAARDYVDKLPILYSEFAEAAQFTRDRTHFIGGFSSASDLMRKTPGFWEKFVLVKLERELGGLHRFLNDPYPNGRNEYLSCIENNMSLLKRRLDAEEMQNA